MALTRPPMVGPVWCAMCSLASPMIFARGTIAKLAITMTTMGDQCKKPAAKVSGMKIKRRLSGLFMEVSRVDVDWLLVTSLSQLFGQDSSMV